MRKAIALIIAGLIMIGCAFSAAADGGDWKQACRETLETTYADAGQEEDRSLSAMPLYALWDLDGDSVPEMIVRTGSGEVDYQLTVYSVVKGSAQPVETIGFWNSALYGCGNGIVVYTGHMGSYRAVRYGLDGARSLTDTMLFEGELDAGELEYPELRETVPTAVKLTLVPTSNLLPLDRYEEICNALRLVFPSADELRFPENDEQFFEKVIAGSGTVIASAADLYSNSPGQISFPELLKKDVAAGWMSGDLEITDLQTADLNGDGKLEAILHLTAQESGERMRFYLSEENGTVYVYIENYVHDNMVIDDNGNLLRTIEIDYLPTEEYRMRLIFDAGRSFFLDLPLS